jgi:hypothetical protein
MTQRAKPLSERAWIPQVVEKYEELEKLQQINCLPSEEPPDWVYGAAMPILGVLHPKLLRKSFRKWTVRDLGYFLGRQSALDNVMWGEVPLSEELVREAVESLATHETVLRMASNPVWVKAKKQLPAGMRKWRALFIDYINDVLVGARGRPYPEP